MKYIIENIQKRIVRDYRNENRNTEILNSDKKIQNKIMEEKDIYDKYELPYIQDMMQPNSVDINNSEDNKNPLLFELTSMKSLLVKKIYDFMILEKQCNGCKGDNGTYICLYVHDCL